MTPLWWAALVTFLIGFAACLWVGHRTDVELRELRAMRARIQHCQCAEVAP